MKTEIVDQYVAVLERTVGDRDAFMTAYNRMTNDPEVQQPEAVGIGSKFVSKMSLSTTKKLAFERILRRHKNLSNFKAKQEAIGGRSAA